MARRRGVVLWVTSLVYNDLVTKKGLHAAGYGVHHLTRPEHNISTTRFGIRVLNPLWTRIEARYLAERVLIRKNDSKSALATLRACLRDNRIVSITVGSRARKTLEFDVLGARRRCAGGPLHLARTMHSVLLPVFTVRERSGAMVVNVESPLITGEAGTEAEPYESVVQRYGDALARYMLQFPDQWNARELND